MARKRRASGFRTTPLNDSRNEAKVATSQLLRKTGGPMQFREKIAWTLLATGVLMVAVQWLGFDEYYRTSILSTFEKDSVVREANKLLGKGYRIGEMGPDLYDCSGYVKTVLERALDLENVPRTSRDMYANLGRAIDKSNLGVGDLVFFDTFSKGYVTHVGIVVDEEGHFANANSYYGATMIDDLNAKYWRDTWIGARELTEADGLPKRTAEKEPVVLVTEEELKPTIYDTVGFPPSEFADPRLDSNNFAAADSTAAVDVVETIIEDTDATGSGAELVLPAEDTVAVSDPVQPVEPEQQAVFSDIPVASAVYEATAYLKEQGIISGYEDGTFRPTRTVSRIELLKMGFRAFDIAPESEGSDFPDVSAAHWGQGYVRAALKRGIVSGYPDGMFRPDQIVSRIEALKILFKTGNLATHEYTEGFFEDVQPEDWYAPYVAAAVQQNLMSGTDTHFDPLKGMTRGEVALFIYKLLKP